MPQTGLFGKLPALGDFVGRRLPQTFIEPWDAWLSRVVAALQAQSPDGWGARYDAWAPRCFALDPGVCGPHPVFGMLVPSRDRVGRRFPLTLAVLLGADADPMQFALGADAWCRLAGAFLRDLGSPGADPAGVESGLDELDRLIAATEPAPVVELASCLAVLRQSGGWQVRLPAGSGIGHHLGALGLIELRRSARGLAAVWPGSGGGALVASAGLPDPAISASLWSEAVAAARSAPRPATPPPLLAPAPASPPPLVAPPPAASAYPAEKSYLLAPPPEAGGETATPTALIAAPGLGYLAVSGWARTALADAAIAQRFRDGFAAGGDAPRALEATFGQPGAGASGSFWVPDEDGGRYAWFGSAAIFRLRGTELTRLSVVESPAAGASLADLLGGPGATAAAAATNVLPADVQDGDRVLLCADGSYGKLSWAQLVSALQEHRAARAASRLAEIWTRPDARVPGAVVLAFDETDEGLEATHALVASAG